MRFAPFFAAALSLAGAALLAPLPAASQTSPDYLGSTACTDCHEAEAAAWAGSHHAWAWTEASPDRVLADFNNTEFNGTGMSVRFSQGEAGQYLVDVTEADGSQRRYPVHSVVGIEPLQQYLLETEPGRLQSFDVVWDTEQGGWFHLYPDPPRAPEDGLHWSGPYKNWNARCAECHATGYEKAFDPASQSYASTQVEIGVGCEACHGPGSAHLDWAEGRDFDSAGLTSTGFSMDFSAENPEAWMDGCAGCHSRREAFGDGSPLPGSAYHDNYRMAALRQGLYHADGQILDEVYVTGSFLQSKMHMAGVSCNNCHEPHSASLRAPGNGVCTQCHSPEGHADFGGAAGLYDDPSHHFHPQGSDGAQCKSCHMMEQVYMGNDWRADHSFRIPRPDLNAQTGAPDACTNCHSDQSPDWAAAEIAERFGPPDTEPASFGRVFAAARARPGVESASLAALAEDPAYPGIVRATALEQLSPASTPALAERLTPLLSDEDALVRAAALPIQRSATPQTRIARVTPLLADPTKTVRIAAAREMLDLPLTQAPPEVMSDLRAAFGEWQASLRTKADFPETHLVAGGSALVMRNAPAAAAAFAEATRLDPQLVQAWVMQVRIAAANGDRAAAEAHLAQALKRNPGDPALEALAAQFE